MVGYLQIFNRPADLLFIPKVREILHQLFKVSRLVCFLFLTSLFLHLPAISRKSLFGFSITGQIVSICCKNHTFRHDSCHINIDMVASKFTLRAGTPAQFN
jgi:hypothetical protein